MVGLTGGWWQVVKGALAYRKKTFRSRKQHTHHKPELKVKERQILPQGHRAFTAFISKPFCDQHFVNFSDCSGKKKGSKQEMKNTAD